MTPRVPPALTATLATDEDVSALMDSCKALGQRIAALPPSVERDIALQRFNECMLWAHQAIIRAAGPALLVSAPGNA